MQRFVCNDGQSSVPLNEVLFTLIAPMKSSAGLTEGNNYGKEILANFSNINAQLKDALGKFSSQCTREDAMREVRKQKAHNSDILLVFGRGKGLLVTRRGFTALSCSSILDKMFLQSLIISWQGKLNLSHTSLCFLHHSIFCQTYQPLQL